MALTKINRGGFNTGISDSSDANAITIDASEKVGIGTASPSTKLHVDGGGSQPEIRVAQNSTYYTDIGVNHIDVNGPNDLRFLMGGAQKARLTSGGVLALGSGTPGSWSTNYPALQIGQGATFTGHAGNTQTQLGQNWWIGTGNQYVVNGAASRLVMNPDSTIIFSQAPSGTAGATMSTVNNRLVIAPSGNIGIGTSAPASPLGANFKSLDINSGVWGGTINFSGNSAGYIGNRHSGNTGLGYYAVSGQGHSFAVNGSTTAAVTISSSGNVGIGTASPDHTLHVLSSSASMAEFASSSASPFINFARSGARTAYIQLHEPGSQGTSQLRFGTGSGHSPTTSMAIDFNNRVGIGTTSPLAILDIRGNTTTYDGMAKIYLTDSNGNSNSRNWSLGNGGSAFGNLTFAVSSAKDGVAGDGSSINVMCLDNSGNVGIGATSPSDKLEVSRTSSDQTVGLTLTNQQTGGYGSGIVWRSKRADNGALDVAGELRVTGENNWNGTGNIAAQMQFATQKDGTLTQHMVITKNGNVGIGASNPGGSRLYLQDTKTATVTNATTMLSNTSLTINGNSSQGSDVIRMGPMGTAGRYFIDVSNGAGSANYGLCLNPIGNGDVLMGCSAQPSGSTGGSGFMSSNHNRHNLWLALTTTIDNSLVIFANPNGIVGQIRVSGSSTNFQTSSDYRLKENVITDWNATDRLKQLKPSRFNFISNSETVIDGFLAHEVSDIVPYAVSGVKDEVYPEDHKDAGKIKPQGIDHSKLVPLLVKTIQELEARIAQLESA